MLFLMVGCVFLGNGVVAWSGRQIRMDVVVRMLPPKVREALDLFSELVFLITAVAIVIFAWPVIRDLAEFDQRSQAADFPLASRRRWCRSASRSWHSSLPCACWSRSGAASRKSQVIEAALVEASRGKHIDADRSRLLRASRAPAGAGAAHLPRAAGDLPCCIVLLVADVPTEAVQTYLFGSLDNFPLLAVPFFVLAGEIMAQGGIARRVVVWVISLIGGVRGSLAVTTVAASELFGAMAHTAVGTVVAVGRMMYPSLRENGYNERFTVGPDRFLRRHCRRHPPFDRDDPLFALGAAVGGGAVHRRHPAEPAHRICRCTLRHGLCPHQGGSAHRRGALGGGLEIDQGSELVHRNRCRHFRRHLRRHLHPYRGGGRGRGLFAVRHHGRPSGGRPARALAHHHERGVPDLADPDDRHRCRALFLAAHDQRHSAAMVAQINALALPPGGCSCRSTSPCW